MLLLWAAVLGVAVGFLRRGSLSNLAQFKLRGAWCILLALSIQVLIFPLPGREAIIRFGTPYFHLISYVFLLLFVALNRRYWQIILMGFGLLSNFVVVALNGGYMPASVEALRGAGKWKMADCLLAYITCGNVKLMSEQTKLNLLGDIFYLPAGVPLASAFSLGDLILALGLILLLQAKMARLKQAA